MDTKKTRLLKSITLHGFLSFRAGFKHRYNEQDYRTITDIADRLAGQVIQEDEKPLMYYDVAAMRLGVE